jgi:hypothetical protein
MGLDGDHENRKNGKTLIPFLRVVDLVAHRFFDMGVWNAPFDHDTISSEEPYAAGSQTSTQKPPSSRPTFPIHRPFRQPSRVRRKPRAPGIPEPARESRSVG